MAGKTRPRVTWARTAERNVWAAPAGPAVLLAARQPGGDWTARVRYGEVETARRDDFPTRLTAQRWAERQASC